MAAATSTPNATYSLKLLVGITVYLWFSLSDVHGSNYPFALVLTDDERKEILHSHNIHRAKVHPYASNMQLVYWSVELEEMAEEHAITCQHDYGYEVQTLPGKYSNVGENIGVSFERNISNLIWYWFYESENYDYETGTCNVGDTHTYTCDHYLHLVWARTCEIGCAIVECKNHHVFADYVYYFLYLLYSGNLQLAIGESYYVVVCKYAPGNPDITRRPYKEGTPCEKCPKNARMCDRSFGSFVYTPLESEVDGQEVDEMDDSNSTGLCYSEAEMCLGSDPHFAIRLSGGHLLCYNFQGVPNTTFNLVSNNHLEMNALFVPDNTNWDNTWLGAIGMTVLHDGKKTLTLEFLAPNHLVRIGGKIPIPAKSIKKLTFKQGKLTILEVPSHLSPKYPRVQVNFVESHLNFTVGFAKNNHLDLYWHSPGVPHEDSRGVVGQFFHHGVRLDVHAKRLHLPGRRRPVPVEQQDLWKFVKQRFHSDTKCWTSAYHSSQGAGIIAGSYEDYIVDDLLAVGH